MNAYLNRVCLWIGYLVMLGVAGAAGYQLGLWLLR